MKSERLDKAAEKLADILESHLATLPPKERKRRVRAFRKVVSRIGAGTRAKRETPFQTQVIPLSARAHE